MSQITLLEKLSINTSIDSLSIEDLINEGFETELATAIFNKDSKLIEKLLGADTNVSVILVPAEDDEEDDSEETEEKIAV